MWQSYWYILFFTQKAIYKSNDFSFQDGKENSDDEENDEKEEKLDAEEGKADDVIDQDAWETKEEEEEEEEGKGEKDETQNDKENTNTNEKAAHDESTDDKDQNDDSKVCKDSGILTQWD